MGAIYIIINIFLYGVLFLYYWRKEKAFNAGVFIVFCWFIVAVFGLMYFHSTDYYRHYSHPITLLPFVAEFILFYIAVKPVLRYDKIINVEANNDSPLLKPLALMVGLLSFPPIIDIVLHMSETTIAANVAEYQMREIEITNIKRWSTPFTSRCYVLVSWLRLVTPALLFYFYKNNSKKIYLLCCFLGILVNPMYGISIGNRGPAISTALYVFVIFLYFRTQLPQKKLKTVKKIFVGIGSIVLIYMTLMTIARFVFISKSAQGSMLGWVLRYAGESFLNMNQDAFWNTNYLWGELTTPEWYQFFSGQVADNRWALMRRIGIRCHVFYTSFGQLFIEFPYILVFAFTVIYALILRALGKIVSRSFGLFVIWMVLCNTIIDGMFIMPLQNSWTAVITAIIIGLIIKHTERKITI